MKRAEVQVTQHLNPEEERRLGPALGVSMKSRWAIKGIPSYADTGMIVPTLAQNTQGWVGWVVRPTRPLTPSRG